MTKQFLFLLFSFFSFSCLAQEQLFNVQFYDQNGGISDRSTFSTVKDDRGTVWVGTGNGLNRFDGKHFKLIQDEQQLLSSGTVSGIKKDKGGRLWIQRRRGPVLLFGPVSETVDSLPIAHNLPYEDFFLLNGHG